ncbi:unnamed protein product [Rhizoctonia solani]|uniref:HMG box domain-containing protein n=1 Tax=Rhizoctonia solani TaxID=456999 RepID=A0A8H2WLA0_9AGAM|nr:unnamed protein product [Rhizoctonia solani]
MSITSKSSRPSRALTSSDSFDDTLISHSAPQHALNNYHNELGHTAFNDTFSCDTPRFPAERGVPSHRLYYPSDDSLLHSGGSTFQVRESPESNHAPVSPHEDIDPARTSTVGPIRVAKNHGRRQLPGHIPRPRNAFILYRSWYVKQGFLTGIENDHREISRIVGRIWRQMSPEERAPWGVMAEKEKAEHARMYPNYKYSPNSRRDAAAASPSSRNVPARSSATCPRKAKVSEITTKKRSDAIAGAFVAGSRRLSLTLGVREIDEQTKAEESEVQSLSLSYPASPSGQLSVEPKCPSSPVYSRAPSVDLASVSDDRTSGSNIHRTLPDINYEPTSDFSLAACSTLPTELNPDSVQLLSPEEYYRCETFLKTALRQDYNANVTLGAGVTCDDANNFSLVKFSTDSNLYSPTSYTSATPSHYPIASEPGLSPFSRVLREGTWAGHPEAIPHDTPKWDTLFSSSSAATNTNSSLPSESLSNFSWGHSQDCPAAEEEYSASSVSGGDTQPDDYGLFSEWCNIDSPITTDGSDACGLISTSLSSGAPSPLSLIYSSSTYPQKHSALIYHQWDTSYEDMDAYDRALEDIKAELDDHRFF